MRSPVARPRSSSPPRLDDRLDFVRLPDGVSRQKKRQRVYQFCTSKPLNMQNCAFQSIKKSLTYPFSILRPNPSPTLSINSLSCGFNEIREVGHEPCTCGVPSHGHQNGRVGSSPKSM